MLITLNLRKTLEQSAAKYFDQAKKLRKKAQGAHETVEKYRTKLETLDKKREKALKAIVTETRVKRTAPVEWYEKFRWFKSSDGFLCVGGRDATTNEIVVKKHTEPKDIIFHTETPGSPFFVVQTHGKTPGEDTIQETADATAIFSKAWKLGLAGAETFWVTPDQVSKQAQSGEYMAKGAFMVRGKRNIIKANMTAAIGKLDDGRVMCGPETAVRTHCKDVIMLKQGRDKPSDVAKKIARRLRADIDDVMRVLPAGGSSV